MNTRTRAFGSIVALFMLTSSLSFCQDSTGRSATALKLLTVMNMEKTLTEAVDVMIGAQVKANPNLKPYEDLMRSFLARYMSWASLKDKMAAIYAQEFTEDEMNQMLAFYQTDVGKKAIEKLPILMSRGAELGQQSVQEHMSEFTDAIHKRDEEMKAGKEAPAPHQ